MRISKNTDVNGQFDFESLDTISSTVIWKKESYYTDSMTFQARELVEDGITVKAERIIGIRLLLKIMDSKTNAPIENVKCSLVEQPSFKEYKRGQTNKQGYFKKTIDKQFIGANYFYALNLKKLAINLNSLS